ncbi:hypothetical protein MICAE_80005 [Microcystis aeruginosa PCC 9806]|uniref:Uncharacterized protein n=1 Tax=Microcystis aeruginosa PCC 9806 TaxID=1160282 RepID=I4H2J7_MICAE|nr:hypothetical protein MICAE_80005 [Microcystis aeruginosa PCC 9806]
MAIMMSTKSFIRKTQELQAYPTIMTLLIFVEDVYGDNFSTPRLC